MTSCQEGSCPALAVLPFSPGLAFVPLWQPIQRHETTPQQRGEGAGPQRQLAVQSVAVQDHLLAPPWAPPRRWVWTWVCHWVPTTHLLCLGLPLASGMQGGKFPFSSINYCNKVTSSPASFGYLFSWHFRGSQRICFPFAVLLPETVIALWTYRSRKPIKGPRGQGFSASQHIPQLLSSCKRRVLLASPEGILLHFVQI